LIGGEDEGDGDEEGEGELLDGLVEGVGLLDEDGLGVGLESFFGFAFFHSFKGRSTAF
jgi:hypothetical protein